MSPNQSRFFWKAILVGGCFLFSSIISAVAFGQPDLIRVKVENSAEFDVQRIMLINSSTNETDEHRRTLRSGSGQKGSVEMRATSAAAATQSFEFQVFPRGKSGARSCVEFTVTSENGHVTKIQVTGPNIGRAVTGERSRVWQSQEGSPQITTISTKLLRSLDRMQCNVKSIGRRGE